MKITDVRVTLFAWDDIPATTYGRHTGRFSGQSQLALVTIATDEGVEGHAFLGSAMRGAHMDAPSLVHYLKPLVLGQEGRRGRGEGRGEGRGQAQNQNLPEAPPIGFFGSYRVAADKMDPSKLPIIGAWRITFAKSDPALKLQNRFKDTGTVIYTAENGGIKQEVFLYWPPTKADYKNVFTDDAREFFEGALARFVAMDARGRVGWTLCSLASLDSRDAVDEGGAAFQGSVGDIFWGGITGPRYFVDPKEKLVGVLFAQGPAIRAAYHAELRAMVYGALTASKAGK